MTVIREYDRYDPDRVSRVVVDGIVVAAGGSMHQEHKRGRIRDDWWERLRWCIEPEPRMKIGMLEPPLGVGVDFFADGLLDSWLMPFEVRTEIAWIAEEEARRAILDEIDSYCAKLRPILDVIASVHDDG